jgi:crotonobetainyl-CoA:carnitine CoA-transferase CaiB-like acyl-CoA transferase
MHGALHDLTVIALEQAVAAPLCSRKMAEAGARVIKIEAAGGDFARHYDAVVDGQSTYFTWLNVGKESVVLDMRADGDRTLLRRMLVSADVFLQNMRPGAAANLGFDPARLRRDNPRLITCDIVGFARPAEHADRKAYDLLIQAEAGLAAVTGMPDQPSRVGVSIVDIATGITAYQAVLEAVLRRERTGMGDSLQISMFDCMAEWMSVPLLYTAYTAREPPKLGLKHPGIAPYGAFVCADQRSLLIAVQQDREWRSLCERVMSRPEMGGDVRFATNVARVANRALVDAAVAQCLSGMTAADAMTALRDADIAYGQMADVADVLGHPALRTFDVQTPAGIVKLPLPAERNPDARAAPARVPACDEHGAAIRTEFAVPAV